MADALKTTVAVPALKNGHIEARAQELMRVIHDENRPPSRSRAHEDDDYWNELFLLVQPPVLYLLRYVFGMVNAEDQNDMFQEVMLRFYRYHLSYDSSRPLLPWLYTIARNVKREWMEKSSIRRLPVSSMLPPRLREEPATTTTPQTSDNHLTSKLTVKAVLDKLPEEDRRILWLFYYQGLTAPEISEHLNIPLTTAKFYLRRAQKRALEILAAHPRRII